MQASDSRTAEAGVLDAAELRAVMDGLDMGFCVVRMRFDKARRPTDYIFLHVNAAFARQTGLEDPVGRSMRALRPDHEAHWFETYGRVAATGEPSRFVAEAAALARWYDVSAFRIGRAGDDKVAIVFDDITERLRQERRLALLRREIDHRARNLLTVVSSLVRLSGADTVEAYRDKLLGRLAALARSQDRLAPDMPDQADFAALAASELEPYRGGGLPRVRCEGPPVTVDNEAAQHLAMTLHELATNAAKYGALSRPGGGVHLAWSLHGGLHGGTLHVTWSEAGGPPCTPPAQRGFGTTMIEACIVGQLGGSVALDWHAHGLRCHFTVPLRHGQHAKG